MNEKRYAGVYFVLLVLYCFLIHMYSLAQDTKYVCVAAIALIAAFIVYVIKILDSFEKNGKWIAMVNVIILLVTIVQFV